MNAERKARWAEIRARGRRRFILIQGVVKIGVMYAAVSLLSRYFYRYGFTPFKVAEYLEGGEPIFRFFFDWLFFGFFMGLCFWYLGEREFRKRGKG